MRFHIGEIPDSPDFVPDARWRRMPEPTPWLMQVFALPLGLALALMLGVLWMTLTPLAQAPPPSVCTLFAALLAMVPAHEALHLVMHPRTGDSIVGFWPARLLFYTHYRNQLPCRRFRAMLLTPLVVLSLLPLAVCALTATASVFLAAASVCNVLFASGDLLAVGLLLAQVPATATLRNKGCRVYWKCEPQ
jgi:hypothetical protein